ncbi:NF038215 family lipoprotein [Acinetobacter sp. YH12201]|uniref:NF038215 family lipoprotein n=1 Tax=Acinetobacter sp. YH12201 TaxID=2601140 RepID=UPI0015D1329B|nr:NF038215 family lipoprotein [Acinetobacter sp. YH12201]
MKTLSVGLSVCVLLLLTACDEKDDYNKPKTEVRSMIIGGVPVHDQDYRLAPLGAREIQPMAQE